MAWITQWQNLKFIYEEFLNKTSLALMVCKRHFLNIFFIYYQVVYLCCILLRCVTAYLFLFLLMTWPEYLFLKKSSRSLSGSNGLPLRDTQAPSPFLS